ncbi:type II toxin-antitoxin system death-on-curing family toxin [Gordonia sp. NPDC003424]
MSEIRFPDRWAVITVGSRACDFVLIVRDEGLLQAAIARPQSSVFGLDAYPTVFDKAAALMHSVARNHPFADGNKRTAWASAWLLLGLNGIELAGDFDVDDAETFVLDASQGTVDDWRDISAHLHLFADVAAPECPAGS